MKLKKSFKLEIVICIIGFLIFMYPTISNYINSKNSSKIIMSYNKTLKSIEDNDNEKIKQEATEFNEALYKNGNNFKLSKELKEKYNTLLNIDGHGNMGYIEIKAINEEIPIYHGVDDNVLNKNIGHIEWSSLPVGGKNTHAVLSAHNGLVKYKLFTDLWKLKNGDIFIIHILNEKLIYEVDQIKTVEPDDYTYLEIEEGKDLVTLLTCTPYGINSNRLLVRGHRITDEIEYESFSPNALLYNKYVIAGFISFIQVILLLLLKYVYDSKKSVRKLK